jgi:hypothetical protein
MDSMEELNSFARKYGLTLRQAQFVLKYDGNGTRTARLAGYKGTDKTLAVTAHRLLSNEKVIRALDRLTEREIAQDSQAKLLTRNDLMAIWSELASDTNATWKDRLKAMDSLAKSQGIFIDRSQIVSNVRIESLDKLTDQELLGKLNDTLAILHDAGLDVRLLEHKPNDIDSID